MIEYIVIGGGFIYYLLALLIGGIISFPIGPLGLLCVQRFLKKGYKIGLFSGIGAALSDLTYGLIVLISFDYLDHFLHKDAKYIHLVLGLIFLILGYKLLRSEDLDLEDQFIHPMLSAYIIGISNMSTLVVYLTIFTIFPVELGIEHFAISIRILLFISAGAITFWASIGTLLNKFRKSFKLHHFVVADRVLGGAIISFGCFYLIKFIFTLRS